eukprot:Platyproteum_vivax@DN3674_c0_g1_i1.p1
MESRIISASGLSEEKWSLIGKRLRDGHLVAFPTETVFGLGGNGLDHNSVKQIFAVKKRPLSDPLICHVNTTVDACKLITLPNEGLEIFKFLAAKFWPGPFSMVCPASDCVPSCVTANTGWLAVRCPANDIAHKLIQVAGVPVAAPSANPFGRISPTTAAHVFEYFPKSDLDILDNGEACNVGIESTVCKIDLHDDSSVAGIVILRKGAVSESLLASTLKEAGFGVPVKNKQLYSNNISSQESPGMSVQHYAPVVPTFLVSTSECSDETFLLIKKAPFFLKECVLLDVADFLACWKEQCGLYIQLHASNGPSDSNSACSTNDDAFWGNVMHHLFSKLHYAESCVLGDDTLKGILVSNYDTEKYPPACQAIHDRLRRCASNRLIRLNLVGSNFDWDFF